jgi:hypothetical protein
MNLYHCMITLKQDAQALSFAAATEKWLNSLKGDGLIGDWALYRRKMGLGSSHHSDMMLEIEVDGLGQLDQAFRSLSLSSDDNLQRMYDQMHGMIANVDVALYRPYPDPQQREQIALI